MQLRYSQYLLLFFSMFVCGPQVIAETTDGSVSVTRSHVLPVVAAAGLGGGGLAALAWWQTGRTLKKLKFKQEYLTQEIEEVGKRKIDLEERKLLDRTLEVTKENIATLQGYHNYARKAVMVLGGAGGAALGLGKLGDRQGWWRSQGDDSTDDDPDAIVPAPQRRRRLRRGTRPSRVRTPRGALSADQQTAVWNALGTMADGIDTDNQPRAVFHKIAHLLDLDNAQALAEKANAAQTPEQFRKEVIDRAAWAVLRSNILATYPEHELVLPDSLEDAQALDAYAPDGKGQTLLDQARQQLIERIQKVASGENVTWVEPTFEERPLRKVLDGLKKIGVLVPKTGITQQGIEAAAKKLGFNSVETLHEALDKGELDLQSLVWDRIDVLLLRVGSYKRPENLDDTSFLNHFVDGSETNRGKQVFDNFKQGLLADVARELGMGQGKDQPLPPLGDVMGKKDGISVVDVPFDGDGFSIKNPGESPPNDEGVWPTINTVATHSRVFSDDDVWEYLARLGIEKVNKEAVVESLDSDSDKETAEDSLDSDSDSDEETAAESLDSDSDSDEETAAESFDSDFDTIKTRLSNEKHEVEVADESKLPAALQKQLAQRRAFALSRLMLLQDDLDKGGKLEEMLAAGNGDKYAMPVDRRGDALAHSQIISHATGDGSCGFHSIWEAIKERPDLWPEGVRNLGAAVRSKPKQAMFAIRRDVADKGAKRIQGRNGDSVLIGSVVERVTMLLRDWGKDSDYRTFTQNTWPNHAGFFMNEERRMAALVAVGNSSDKVAQLLKLLSSDNAIDESAIERLAGGQSLRRIAQRNDLLAEGYKAFVGVQQDMVPATCFLAEQDIQAVVAPHYLPCVMMTDRAQYEGGLKGEGGLIPRGVIGDVSTVKNVAEDVLWIVQSPNHFNVVHPRMLQRAGRLIKHGEHREFVDPLALSLQNTWQRLAATFPRQVKVPADLRDYSSLKTIASDFGFVGVNPQAFFDAFARKQTMNTFLVHATWRHIRKTYPDIGKGDLRALEEKIGSEEEGNGFKKFENYYKKMRREVVAHYGIELHDAAGKQINKDDVVGVLNAIPVA